MTGAGLSYQCATGLAHEGSGVIGSCRAVSTGIWTPTPDGTGHWTPVPCTCPCHPPAPVATHE